MKLNLPKKVYFMRCSYPECFAILLKEDKDKGGCSCGLNKFRGVPLGAGKLTPVEEKLFEDGLVHLIDVDMVGPDPDVLNLDNESYWAEVKERLGRQRARAKKQAAEKKRHLLEKWYTEEDIDELKIKGAGTDRPRSV